MKWPLSAAAAALVAAGRGFFSLASPFVGIVAVAVVVIAAVGRASYLASNGLAGGGEVSKGKQRGKKSSPGRSSRPKTTKTKTTTTLASLAKDRNRWINARVTRTNESPPRKSSQLDRRHLFLHFGDSLGELFFQECVPRSELRGR